jgi:two-component system chemotaxis response regulator CheB
MILMSFGTNIYRSKSGRNQAAGGEGAGISSYQAQNAKLWRKPTDKVLIAIGASTGGTEAIAELVSALPAGLPGIVIVQHMPQDFTSMFADRLHSICSFEASEAKDGDIVAANTALVAPGNYQLRVVRRFNGFGVSVAPGEKVSGHCPSVDVMFRSVAEVAGARAIGVILTGMGQDGAYGLLEMKNNGAKTIGQDEKSCVVYGMPKVAYDIGAVDYQLPISQIAAKILELL